MELLLSFGTFGLIALLAAISPGPDFLIVSKNSIGYSRKVGVVTALGVGSAIMVHVGYTVIGVGLIISKSVLLFSIIKSLGALYLCYLGLTLLFSKHQALTIEDTKAQGTKTLREAFREGFLTNVLNPKATVFFVSVFSQIVPPSLPIAVQSLYGVEAAVIVSTWFAILAILLTLPKIKASLGKFQSKMLTVMGAALLLLGARLAFESNK